MSTASDSIRVFQGAFRPVPLRPLGGIPVPRYTVGPCAAGGYEVTDGTVADAGKARRSLCATDTDAQHQADDLNRRDDWEARRRAQAKAALEQGESFGCETDR